MIAVRKLLNTLYVTSPEAHLGREGENVLVYVDNEVRFRIPIHNLEGIVTFGYTGASPSLMHLCAARGVALSFMSPSGRLLAKLSSPVSGNVLLRKRQYTIRRLGTSLEYAALFLENYLTPGGPKTLLRVLRGVPGKKSRVAAKAITRHIEKLLVKSLDSAEVSKVRPLGLTMAFSSPHSQSDHDFDFKVVPVGLL